MEFRAATPANLPSVLQLLEQAGLPTAGVSEHLAGFVLAFEGRQLAGCAGLEAHAGAGLLRSVAVAPDYRSRGLGQQLVEQVIEAARQQQLSSLSLLTTTAEGFFPRFGFAPLERRLLPPQLGASQELQGACPQSAVAMMLPLTPEGDACVS